MKKIILLLLFVAVISHAQWQPDVRLTYDPQTSDTESPRSIETNGNDVHVVWADTREGNWEIYYKRSSDAGLSWGTDTRLTNDTASSGSPSISLSGTVLHVVWDERRNEINLNGNIEIYYKNSTNGGMSWGPDTRLTNNTASSQYPSIAVSGSVVHVVWQDYRDLNMEVYYKRSLDGGISWGADTRLTNNIAGSYVPSVSVLGSVVHVAWLDNRDGNAEIYYKRSTDGGVIWGADIRLTDAPGNSWHPSVSLSGSLVHVVWDDLRDGNKEIYYKRSTDGGTNWDADTRLTNEPADSEYPSISGSGSNVHVAWQDRRDEIDEIYYKRSTDGGINWGTDTRLTNNPFPSILTSISVSGSVVHVVWNDTRDGNLEVYYKRDPTGNLIGLINITSEIPKDFSLSQNFPNPFNPSTIIRFKIKDSRLTTLKVFDVLCREMATLVNEKLSPGTYEVNWDASSYPSGVYYYRISAGDFNETRKMILVK